MSAAPTARTERNERLNALRRQLILGAAQRVFERDGLEKTTIRAIAKEAGCTTGAIYPWFAGKETLYGALLDESLGRLHAHLDEAASTGPASGAARKAIHAFFGYYAQRRTDFSLGMYLFQGLGPRGLGRDMDEKLNARLRQCVDLLGGALARSKGWDADTVAVEQMNLFTYLMGLLLLLHTHRLKSLGQQADALLDHYCLALEQR
ncbi:TetR/AcrR family transcriptional regulator [Achromobacter sp. AGC78]|jgi:AcrR family transcriptional regulator|uniref:TetR/AcrR family transcriptional regulator n=2 Tax=Achromobacter spanius TaxID=217203 RepID=A0AA42S518_9BURK|nr:MULTISPECIES: TetR/AcrR family transcriptional regulator [Achromobacter]MCS3508807.1 AcrR family transcriptional regulator [Achromobacter sp. JUb104]MDH0737408.1 TetR/AcrR family transcriptional regulator [Achromobacter spanius]